jgi:hypothetical protein
MDVKASVKWSLMLSTFVTLPKGMLGCCPEQEQETTHRDQQETWGSEFVKKQILHIS